jgi:hypothetical protein
MEPRHGRALNSDATQGRKRVCRSSVSAPGSRIVISSKHERPMLELLRRNGPSLRCNAIRCCGVTVGSVTAQHYRFFVLERGDRCPLHRLHRVCRAGALAGLAPGPLARDRRAAAPHQEERDFAAGLARYEDKTKRNTQGRGRRIGAPPRANSRKTQKVVQINPHRTLRQSLVFFLGFLILLGFTERIRVGNAAIPSIGGH